MKRAEVTIVSHGNSFDAMPIYRADQGDGTVVLFDMGYDRRIVFVSQCCATIHDGPVTLNWDNVSDDDGGNAEVLWRCTTPGCIGTTDDNVTELRFSWDAAVHNESGGL